MALDQEDAFDLAAVASQAMSNNKDTSDAALIALKKPLERLAAAIAGRDSWLVDDAWSIVWAAIMSMKRRNLRFTSARSAFAWCATVLRNHFRRENVRPRRAPLPMPGPVLLEQTTERAPGCYELDDISKLELATPFPNGGEDLKTIGSWPPKLRVRMMCMSRLWLKVPPELWDVWVEQAGLSLPFPPDELRQRLLQSDDKDDRIEALAAAGVAKTNTLQVMWGDGHERLWELKFVKAMFPMQAETFDEENHP